MYRPVATAFAKSAPKRAHLNKLETLQQIEVKITERKKKSPNH